MILVDDGSQEDAGPVLDRFRDGRVQVIRHGSNRGVSAARNTGIKAAKGRFVCFLDSDDEWLPGKVSRQLADLQGRGAGHVSYCFSELILDGADGESPVCVGVKDFQEEGDILRFALRSNVRTKVGNALCVLMNEIMISREDLLRAGGFNERYRLHEDWDMLIRLASRYRFSCVKEVLVRNHKHGLGHADGQYSRVPEVRRSMMEEHRRLFLADRSARAAFYSELAYYQALGGRRGEAFLSLLKCAAGRPWDRDPYVKMMMLLMNRVRPFEDGPSHG